ncbi:MAG: orotate phosphoribosyltransferase [Actinomycetaceae bacterium]|nr:orotate phosphoribosyltransferase [Actinomycetaceae bacterium]
MVDTRTRIASGLLEIGAVFFRPHQPFTWASGIKSPVYCDNRLILSAPDLRNLVENALADLISATHPGVEMIMGTATAGIAHAALVAERLNLPAGYVRAASKDHGRQNQIEGKMAPGTKVVVVEDLISTGGSVLDAVAALREGGATVLGVVSIFSYGMQKGKRRFEDANVAASSLITFDVMAHVAADSGFITQADVAKLLAFRDNPADKSWMDKNNNEGN